MMPPRTLLSTNVRLAYMRGEPIVVSRAEAYLNTHVRLNFSVFTRYTILKSLKAKGATARLRAFDRLCSAANIFELTDALVEQASDIYVDIYSYGEAIDDADALISAIALVQGMALATNNERHFSRITGLQVDN
jgi:tRNA(fMet)-specific endonuclease VapC